MAQLEDRLGVRLLLRSTHGLTPTEAGRNFYERAKRTIEEAEQAEAAARGDAASLKGRLRVSAPVTFARLHVVPHLPVFLTEHPALDIDVILDDGDIDPVESGIDVALRLGNFANSTLTARKVGDSRALVVGARSYFEAHGLPQTPSELVAHQAVIYEHRRAGGTIWIFRQGTTEVTVTVSGRLHVSAAEGVREGVLAGLGISVGGSNGYSRRNLNPVRRYLRSRIGRCRRLGCGQCFRRDDRRVRRRAPLPGSLRSRFTMKKPVSSQPAASLDWMAAFKLTLWTSYGCFGSGSCHSRRND